MRRAVVREEARETYEFGWFLPREHGATAMLLTPIVCAAILVREWRWCELATLTAAFAALAVRIVGESAAHHREFVVLPPADENGASPKLGD